MREFTDNAGRKWRLAININVAKAVKAATGFDVLTAAMEKLGDPYLLVDVLYTVCKSQADGQSVTAEQFGEGLAGDAIEQALDALLGAVTDFFPSGRRTVLQTTLAKMKEAEATVLPMLAAKIEKMDLATLIAEAEETLGTIGESAAISEPAAIPGPPSTNQPESSESSPAPSA